MIIQRINAKESISSKHGLEKIEVEKLSSIVLIAGKNGAGKSRLLEMIYRLAQHHQINSTLASIETHKKHLEDAIKQNSESVHVPGWIKNLNEVKEQLEMHHTLLIEGEFLPEKVIYFFPKQLELRDPNTILKNEMLRIASAIKNPGVEELHQGTLSYIQLISDRHWNVTHPSFPSDNPDKELAIKDHKDLSELIEKLLHTKLGRDTNGDATLFGFPLGNSRLSDGQKILLQLCAVIHAQKQKISEMVLLLDEPENHLHPAALLDVLDTLRNCLNNGQLIIATHSINVLAHYDPDCIWYMESNKIQYAGKIPHTVLAGLLGDEAEIARLSNFLALPAQNASLKFAAESLFPPTPLGFRKNDPQTIQICEALSQLNQFPIRLLDFGAGKGRLIPALAEAMAANGMSIKKDLDYRAFDVNPSLKRECETQIHRYYDPTEKRIFNSKSELLTSLDKGTFHVVVMCNVFHEIDPKDWLSTFSFICELLTANGALLLVEDQHLPHGEKAYEHGFLVLDTSELKQLFLITESDFQFKFHDARGDGRLKLHVIPRMVLDRLTSQSRKLAIAQLRENAMEQILSIRSAPPNFKNGLLHGFWAQQFTNASIVLKELGCS